MKEHILGRHWLIEYSGCEAARLSNVAEMERALVSAAEAAGATVVQCTFHHFSPLGVSGVVVIQESHLTVHTWPELCYAAVDIFTCGENVNPEAAHQYLRAALGAKEEKVVPLSRGPVRKLSDRR